MEGLLRMVVANSCPMEKRAQSKPSKASTAMPATATEKKLKIIFFVLMLGLGRVVHLNKKALFRNQLSTTRPYFVSPIPSQPSSVPSDKRSRRPSRGFVNTLEPSTLLSRRRVALSSPSAGRKLIWQIP
ncbi:hypothetical protein C1H46_021502 [Malus baccata]|uniref:Uncharacterized protein n=1 Tax=Malus baccata TaxID=106549 RepID=A0A540M2V5_MALBA|nr:hypothetical protein C1H46_021502 [Malus baccata]